MDRRSAVCERGTDRPKTPANDDEDFRRKVVHQLIGTGRPRKEVSRDLGISANSLRQWRDRALGVSTRNTATAAVLPAASVDPAAELRRLQREVEHLRRQRDTFYL